jgi:hypothetical protein
MVLFGSLAQAVENDARLNARQLCGGINGDELVHVPREVEDHGHIDALASEAGSRSARQDGSACCATGGQSGFDIGGVARQNYANGKLTVIRGVGGVKSAGTEIEADVTREGFFEQGFQLAMGGKAFMIQRRLVEKRGKRRMIHAERITRSA